MNTTYLAPAGARRTRLFAFAALVTVVTALLGLSAWSARPILERIGPGYVGNDVAHLAMYMQDRDDIPDRPPRREQSTPVSEADGVVPEGVTVFDDGYPAVANLDPDLLRALRQAATDAADDNIVLYVTSGWRSPAYQDQLLQEAIAEYGSEEEAARWVATAESSAHVSGDAVDIGPDDAMAWLSAHGAGYGLCQVYGNEPWHFELRPDAIRDGCPPMFDDPTDDPRLQP